MIPTFPEFKKLSIEDNDLVEAYTRKFPYYSDYTFSSLWCWDINHERELSLLNDNLVVKFTDYETGVPFLSFLGINNATETALTLIAYCEAVGLPPELKLMPEISVYTMESDDLLITPDRGNFDYIYLAPRMAALSGNQLKSKRQAADFFTRTHPDHTFEVRSLEDLGVQQHVREIALLWKERRADADDQSINHELEAIENIFTLASMRDLSVGFVNVNGEPTSFTLEEVVNQVMAIAHFWKTANRVDGEYEFLARRMAVHMIDREVMYLNWEQDLNIENLRISKCGYRPSDFLKKFTVRKNRPKEKGIIGLIVT